VAILNIISMSHPNFEHSVQNGTKTKMKEVLKSGAAISSLIVRNTSRILSPMCNKGSVQNVGVDSAAS
jgi:hypothetical protein